MCNFRKLLCVIIWPRQSGVVSILQQATVLADVQMHDAGGVLSCSGVELLPKYFCFFHCLLDRNTSY